MKEKRKKKKEKSSGLRGQVMLKPFLQMDIGGHPWRKGGGLIPWDQMDVPKICSPPDGEGVV